MWQIPGIYLSTYLSRRARRTQHVDPPKLVATVHLRVSSQLLCITHYYFCSRRYDVRSCGLQVASRHATVFYTSTMDGLLSSRGRTGLYRPLCLVFYSREGTALYRPFCSVLYSRGGGAALYRPLCSVLYSRKEGTALYRPLCSILYRN